MAKLKLHQVVALVDGKKKGTETTKTEEYHKIQRSAGAANNPLEGIRKVYRPKNPEIDDERLPEESRIVQVKVKDSVLRFRNALEDAWDCVLTQDVANMSAKADIIIDGQVYAKDVPVTHLMWLEKQVIDFNTFLGKLPTLDPSHKWDYDSNVDVYTTRDYETHRTKKVQKVVRLAEATKEHPEQAQLVGEDIITGFWNTTHFSGAIPAEEKNNMIARNQKLLEAVKVARTKANDIEVTDQKQAKSLLDFVVGNLK